MDGLATAPPQAFGHCWQCKCETHLPFFVPLLQNPNALLEGVLGAVTVIFILRCWQIHSFVPLFSDSVIFENYSWRRVGWRTSTGGVLEIAVLELNMRGCAMLCNVYGNCHQH